MTIGVVILNYKTWEATVSFVEALQKQSLASQLSIVVVDNGSDNGSYEHLLELKSYDNVAAVLQSGANLGYAKGNNVGLQWLDENVSPDYVVIANTDIVLSDTCIEQLVERFPTLERACIISPIQLLPDGRKVYGWNLGSWCNDIKNLSLLYRWLGKRCQSKEHSNQHVEQALNIPVEQIPGSFMFASFPRFKEIDFFYPDTFLYVEERFVAYATKEAGYQNYILSDMSYLHEHSKTINTAFSQYQKYKMQYDGWLKFTRLCRKYGALKAAIMRPLIGLSLAEIWCVYKLKSVVRG